MPDNVGSKVRERIIIEKRDHTVDPPRLIEEIDIITEGGVTTTTVRRPVDASKEL